MKLLPLVILVHNLSRCFIIWRLFDREERNTAGAGTEGVTFPGASLANNRYYAPCLVFLHHVTHWYKNTDWIHCVYLRVPLCTFVQLFKELLNEFDALFNALGNEFHLWITHRKQISLWKRRYCREKKQFGPFRDTKKEIIIYADRSICSNEKSFCSFLLPRYMCAELGCYSCQWL